MTARVANGFVPIEVVRPIIEELAREAGGVTMLAHQASADGRMSYAQADRRLRQWRNPEPMTVSRGRRTVQTQVSERVLDLVLSALDQTHLWSRIEEMRRAAG